MISVCISLVENGVAPEALAVSSTFSITWFSFVSLKEASMANVRGKDGH